MVLLDIETFKELEGYAKGNGLKTYGDAVKKMLEEVRQMVRPPIDPDISEENSSEENKPERKKQIKGKRRNS